ncbi:MAG TPA: HEAT repeat domain-containing protein [bacterium]|nr:HEAT repeat domain-containing protein [bacterium]
MEETRVIRDDIGSLIAELRNSYLVKREEAFKRLVFHQSDRSIETVCALLFDRPSQQNMYWLCRYLVSVERPAAYEKLFGFVRHEEPWVRREVMAAVPKLPPDIRCDFLIRMLDVKWEEELCFAIRELGALRRNKATLPILDVYKKYPDSAAICASVCVACALIKDERSISAIEKLAGVQDAVIQDLALHALAKFEGVLTIDYLMHLLRSHSEKIREFAYFLLLRSKEARAERAVSRALAKEAVLSLKVNVIIAISTFKTPALLYVVYRTAREGKTVEERMMAHSALRRGKTSFTLRWLLWREKWADARGRVFLLQVLAEYGEPVEDLLIRRFSDTGQLPAVRLTAIEGLGKVRTPSAVQALIKVMNEKSDFSYAAALSLCDVLEKAEWPRIVEAALAGYKERGLIAEVFLRFVMRLSEGTFLPLGISDLVTNLATQAASWHQRFLAAACLPIVPRDISIPVLLGILQNDPDGDVRCVASEKIGNVLHRSPSQFSFVMERCVRNRSFFVHAKQLMAYLPVTQPECDIFFREIISEAVRYLEKDMPVMSLRFTALLKAYAGGGGVELFRYASGGDLTDSEWTVILSVMGRFDISEFMLLDVGYMARPFKAASERVKVLFLGVFCKVPVRNADVRNAIFSAASGVYGPAVEAAALKTVSVLMSKATSASTAGIAAGKAAV